MKDDEAVSRLLALGHPTRLTALRLLALEPDGLMPSLLAERLGVARNAMSPHLKVLTGAGLVTANKSGRNVTYRVVDNAVRDVAVLVGSIVGAD